MHRAAYRTAIADAITFFKAQTITARSFINGINTLLHSALFHFRTARPRINRRLSATTRRPYACVCVHAYTCALIPRVNDPRHRYARTRNMPSARAMLYIHIQADPLERSSIKSRLRRIYRGAMYIYLPIPLSLEIRAPFRKLANSARAWALIRTLSIQILCAFAPCI